MISLTTQTRRPRGCGKSRAVESEENQKQVFLPSHRPWKSRKTRGIPTFPTAPTAAGISQTTSGNLIVVDRKECLTPDKKGTVSLGVLAVHHYVCTIDHKNCSVPHHYMQVRYRSRLVTKYLDNACCRRS